MPKSPSPITKQKKSGKSAAKAPVGKTNKSNQPNAMWGGHFSEGAAEIMTKINSSLEADQHLWREDIAASEAHVAMLAACSLISKGEAKQITKGLATIRSEIENGTFVFREDFEDIHMNIEARLVDLIGEAGGKLHTARSRNDQVATDLRLWNRNAIDRLISAFKGLQRALLARADEHAATIMPGYTHLQPAQPITLGHHFMAYVEMLARDVGRLADTRKRLNESPLGAAALAGTSFKIDRKQSADAMDFDRPMANSLDAVSARDFILETLSALSIAGITLSRLAEEIVLWTSDAFRFITLPESLTTGSSIMPQKRNPDAAELVRAKAGTIFGTFTQVMMVIKGLPLAYNKDLQETKLPLITAVDDMMLMLDAMTRMIASLKPNVENMLAATQRGFITATDFADYLVSKLGMPFRNAHHVTGKLVRMAEGRGCRLDELSLDDLQSVEQRLTMQAMNVLNVKNAVESRRSFGGTSPLRVKEQVKGWEKTLGKL